MDLNNEHAELENANSIKFGDQIHGIDRYKHLVFMNLITQIRQIRQIWVLINISKLKQ